MVYVKLMMKEEICKRDSAFKDFNKMLWHAPTRPFIEEAYVLARISIYVIAMLSLPLAASLPLLTPKVSQLSLYLHSNGNYHY